MQLIRSIAQLTQKSIKSSVVTIGKYDGIHKGHINIIKRVVSDAKKRSCKSAVITFEPEPSQFLKKEKHLGRILRLREKLICFSELGVDYLLCLRFNENFLRIGAEQFIDDILLDKLKMKEIVIGDDFRFGSGGIGNKKLLEETGEKAGFSVIETEPLYIDKIRVSSTNIREFLYQGDLEKAALFLGRSYFLYGKIIKGDKRGGKLGYKTANIRMPFYRLVLQGVFVVRLLGITDKPLFGVANLGPLPTFNILRTRLEVHILDFNQNIYHKNVRVEFLHKLREPKHFKTKEMLIDQIIKDIVSARGYLYEK